MELLVVSFVAGILTVLAPCVLPLIPIIVGGSAAQGSDQKPRSALFHPLIIVSSLIVSVILFTLLLKSTTALLGVPTAVWNTIAGTIIVALGINTLFPTSWEWLMIRTGLQARASQMLGGVSSPNPVKRDILLGAALGPVFNSCSPTYALIVAVILPASFGAGLGYLAAYVIGLGAVLLLISVFGRSLIDKIKWMGKPNGWFQRALGVLLVIVGIMIIFGFDKQLQAYVLEQGWYDPIMRVEESFR